MSIPVAIIGCGGVSAMHLDGCARRPERVQVVAACDPDPVRLAEAREKYGIEHGFASVADMIDGSRWDTAIVCTPTGVREAVVGQLAAAGKNALVEKPLAASLEEGRRMVETCVAAGVRLAVDQNFRYHYPFHIAKEQIAAGLLGAVTAIHLQHLCFRQDSGWRLREKRHTLEIMGVHWLDGFRWILGSDAQTVSAQMRHSNAIDCTGETDLGVQVSFANSTFATYADSFSSHIARAETLILGEKGTLRLEYAGAAFFDRSGTPQPALSWDNPYAGSGKPDSAFRCLDELLGAIERDVEPENSGSDNLKTLSLMEAAYRSAETGETVALREGLL